MTTLVPPPRRASAAQKAAPRPSTPPPAVPSVAIEGLAKPSAQRSSYRVCFERFITEARALPAGDVVVCRADTAVALANVRYGLDNLAPHLADMPRHLPEVRLARLTSIADAARAVVYAGMLIPQQAASNEEIRTRSARLLPVRAQMLSAARTLVDRKALPASALDGVGRQRGPRAMASDAVRLADVFGARANAIRGMHPFSAAEIDQLRADGEWLLEALHPGRAKRRKTRRDDTPAGDRDRLWTVLVGLHETLRRVAHYFHGDGFDTVVPPLQSRIKAPLLDEQVDGPPPAPPTG